MQAPSPQSVAAAWLVPIAGPPLEPIQLLAKDEGLTIGRHEQCDIKLPADAEKVSRFHARLHHDGQTWKLADLNSRWGTYLNGIRVNPGPEVPLREGDLLRITPWTFSISPSAKRRGLQAVNDAGQTIVRAVAQEHLRPMADEMLSLLLESAGTIHAAEDERQLADLLMDAALRGTGLNNAAMLRPIDTAGHVEVIATRQTTQVNRPGGTGGATYSRSLLAAASAGQVAELSGGAMGDNVSQSIVQMKIQAAICVPLMLGSSVAAYLYLDSRGNVMQTLRPNASAFCVALGRMGSLALANLKRIDMEKRQAMITADLAAAATAQKWIMPQRHSAFAPFSLTGESKPGQYVGGDFFDIIPLGDGRVAVAVGDVTGKGVAASVLMTATQGFLHASLAEHGDVARAVNAANQFVAPRRPDSKFVTMWVGVFDANAGTITYVDAGHSYALMQRRDGSFEHLSEGGGLPVGVEESWEYAATVTRLAPGDHAMVVSDGIIEQYGMVQRPDGSIGKEQFEMAGVQRAMERAGADPVADLFAAVVDHAGTTQLSDDATVVLVKW